MKIFGQQVVFCTCSLHIFIATNTVRNSQEKTLPYLDLVYFDIDFILLSFHFHNLNLCCVPFALNVEMKNIHFIELAVAKLKTH